MPLRVLNIFLQFDGKLNLPQNHEIFFGVDDPIHEFEMLESGQYSQQPMFILQILKTRKSEQYIYHGTLQYYIPDGRLNKEKIKAQTEWILTSGLEKILPGLSTKVKQYLVYDPERYAKEFQLIPIVYNLAPRIGNQRFPWKTAIENLYCVGDSVQPERPSVPQAIQSGLFCAQSIIDEYKL